MVKRFRTIQKPEASQYEQNGIFSKIIFLNYFYNMGAILIKADRESNRILTELAKKLGGEVIDMNDKQFEDLMLGSLMDKVKTGKTVSRSVVLKKNCS